MKMPEMGSCLFPVFLCPKSAEGFCEKGRSAVLSVFHSFDLRIRKGKEMDSPEHVR